MQLASQNLPYSNKILKAGFKLFRTKNASHTTKKATAQRSSLLCCVFSIITLITKLIGAESRKNKTVFGVKRFSALATQLCKLRK